MSPVLIPAEAARVAAAARTAPAHRGLLVVYLGGGLDNHQLLSPRRGANRKAYEAARGALALPDLPAGALSADWQLHPSLVQLKRRWDRGQLALIPNIGPLLRPTRAADYRQRSVPLPPQLYSHADQADLWQIGGPPAQVAGTGWLGRLMEALAPAYNPGARLVPLLSSSGPQKALIAPRLRALGLGPDGAEARHPGWRIHPEVVALAQRIMNRAVDDQPGPFGHPIADEYARAQRRAEQAVGVVGTALAGVTLKTPFPQLGALRTAARLFKADAALGRRRSVHFLVHGGYDHHHDLQNALRGRLTELDAGLGAFLDALDELGLGEEVCTLVYSEFGRSLVVNGSGSDHGWGGHALLLGGGVRGGLHGALPDLNPGSPDLLESRGLLLPSLATEQLHGELARWMGLPHEDLAAVLPNHARFPERLPLFA